MSITWFRLYHDMPNDRKLRKFSPQQKWAWVVLLCLASDSKERGFVDTGDEEDLADYCGFESTQDFQFFLDKLRQKGMIEPFPGRLKITHWEDRQYEKPSDKPEAIKARVAKHRAKKKAQKEGVTVTPCNALQTLSNADETPKKHPVTDRTDTDTDTKKKEEIMSPEGDVSRVTSDKPKKRKDASYYLKKCSEAYRSKFEDWWTWYKSRCEDLGSHYGSKASAAQVWAQMEKGFDIEQFRLGCSTWFKEAKAKGSKAPHGCIFLKGKDTHKDPYWVAALESLKPQQKSDFLAASPVQTLTITPEQEAELRAKDPMELTDEEFALLNPGFKIYGKGAA